MKTKSILLSLFILIPYVVFSQGAWTQRTSFPLPGRQYACGFSIGDFGYYAFGCYLNNPNSVNLVEYNPTTNSWLQKSNFPGNARLLSHVFVIDSFAYFVSGAYWSGQPNDYTCYNDMWVYKPYNDSWTQLNNFPGISRHGGFAFAYNGKGYFGLGIDENMHFLNDFWEYNPATDTWTQKSNFIGIKRKSGCQFSIGKSAYVGLGYDSTLTALNDFWEYDAIADSWIQKNNFPDAPRCWLSCCSTNNYGYVITGYLLNSSVNTKQFWEYNPSSDSWTALPDFSGLARNTASAFSIDGKIYNGMGYSTTYLNDFWEYTPTTEIVHNFKKEKLDIKIYPNPTIDHFNIEIPKLLSVNNQLEVIDESAHIILKLQIDGNPQLLTLNCSSWSRGKYCLVLISGQDKWVTSVTIK